MASSPRTPPTPFPAGEYHDDDDELVDSFLDGLDEATRAVVAARARAAVVVGVAGAPLLIL